MQSGQFPKMSLCSIDKIFMASLASCDAAALTSFCVQWKGEFGSRGILPAAESVAKLQRIVKTVRARANSVRQRARAEYTPADEAHEGFFRKILHRSKQASLRIWGLAPQRLRTP